MSQNYFDTYVNQIGKEAVLYATANNSKTKRAK